MTDLYKLIKARGFDSSPWVRLLDAIEAAGLKDAIHIGQIKEKFGGLRFYYDVFDWERADSNLMETLIRQAEKEAYRT